MRFSTNIINAFLASLLILGVEGSALAGQAHAPVRYYKVNFQILLNDEVKATPSAIAVARTPVTTVMKIAGTLYKLHYEFGDTIKDQDGNHGVWLQTRIYKEEEEKWSEIGSPRIGLRLGQEGSANVESTDGSKHPWAFGIVATASEISNQQVKALLGGTVPKVHPCHLNDLSPIEIAKLNAMTPSTGTTPHMKQECCRAGCGDGSGNTMTCCGAISCCACGVCCSP